MPIQTNYMNEQAPPWFNAIQNDIANRSLAHSREGYNPYTQQRVASLFPVYPEGHPLAGQPNEQAQDQQRALQIGRQTGDWAPYLNMSRDLLQAGTQDFPGQAARYMNPYQQQVVNNLIQQSGRAFNENILPQLERTFVGLGSHGSMRHQELVARAARDQQEALNRQIGESLHAGYGQAGQLFTADQLRNIQAAEQGPSLAASQQGARLADVATLQNQADLQRGNEQSNMDVRFQDYLKQNAYPREALAHHAGIMQGVPHEMSSYSVSQTPGTPQLNTTGQIGALAGNLLGAGLAYGRRKKGGSIKAKRYSGGGQVLDEQDNVYYPGMNMAKGGVLKAAKTPKPKTHNVSGVKNHPFTQTSFYKKPKVGGKHKVQGMYK